MRTASKEGDVGNGSRLRLTRQQHGEAGAGYSGDIHSIIAVDISHVGEDVPTTHGIISRRAKCTRARAQNNAYRGIAVVGRYDVEFAITIEISNRQVVGARGRRAVGLDVLYRRLEGGGRRRPLVKQNIDGIVRSTGSSNIRESIPIEVTDGYRTYLAGSACWPW